MTIFFVKPESKVLNNFCEEEVIYFNKEELEQLDISNDVAEYNYYFNLEAQKELRFE